MQHPRIFIAGLGVAALATAGGITAAATASTRRPAPRPPPATAPRR